jgi:hypothetical protein
MAALGVRNTTLGRASYERKSCTACWNRGSAKSGWSGGILRSRNSQRTRASGAKRWAKAANVVAGTHAPACAYP